MDEIVELKDLEVKKLFLTQQRLEDETGQSIHDILFQIIYGNDPSLALEAIKVIYEVIFSSNLTMEDIEEHPELAEVLPFGRKNGLEED